MISSNLTPHQARAPRARRRGGRGGPGRVGILASSPIPNPAFHGPGGAGCPGDWGLGFHGIRDSGDWGLGMMPRCPRNPEPARGNPAGNQKPMKPLLTIIYYSLKRKRKKKKEEEVLVIA